MQDECHWGVVELPLTQDVASLDYQVEIKLCYLPKGNEYYYDITEDTSRHHGLYEVEEKVCFTLTCNIHKEQECVGRLDSMH